MAAGDHPGVVSIPGICGGEVCIERTRIPVWILYRLKQLGMTDPDLLEDYPDLTQHDLDCAWKYVAAHQSEIDQAVRRNGN